VKRVAGTILFGLGVLFVVLAIGLPLYVAPSATKLPYDLKRSTAVAEAKNATFLQIKQGTAPTVHTNMDIRSTSTVVPQPILTEQLQKEFKDKAVVWDVYSSSVRVDNSEKISESVTEIALDRVSGEPVNWSGAWVNDGTKTTTKFSGQIYKFPFDTQKKDYKYWDGDMGASAPPAKFEAVDSVGGVEVYRFKQVIPWVKTDTDKGTVAFLLSTFAPKATGGDIWYQNTRTLWVEPVTGQFLNVREQREQELRDDTGGKTTLLKADFSYTKQTQDNSVKTAKDNKTQVALVSLWGPIVLGVLGLILVILGALMTRGPRRYQGEHTEYEY
jgi:Porin PorA